MSKIISLALKDLRLMPRNRGGMFFTFVWPIIVTVLFGFAFGGNNSGTQPKPRIAVVDHDQSDGSKTFLTRLESSFELTPMAAADAEDAVRRGQRTGYIIITKGFGEASDRMFYGPSRQVELGVDPARQAESGMIEGLLMKAAAEDMQKMFNDPSASTRMVDKALDQMQAAPSAETAPVARFLGELKSFVNTPSAQRVPRAGGGDWQPLKVTKKDVARQRVGPDNAFDVTFPQGVIWGLIGCVMTFGISLVTERTHGTLVRLRMAPLTRAQILGGKALACLVSIMLVELILLGVAKTLGVHPSSYGILALAGLSCAICFVGFMMLIASLGKTEQTAAGAAWAIIMPMSMFGGVMIPQFVMPQWMQTIGLLSPMRWGVLAIEGGIWRAFSVSEMVLPCSILVTIGVLCFAAGTRGLKEA